jgi:hypothetical protein
VERLQYRSDNPEENLLVVDDGGRPNTGVHHGAEHQCPVFGLISIFASHPPDKISIVEVESEECAGI